MTQIFMMNTDNTTTHWNADDADFMMNTDTKYSKILFNLKQPASSAFYCISYLILSNLRHLRSINLISLHE